MNKFFSQPPIFSFFPLSLKSDFYHSFILRSHSFIIISYLWLSKKTCISSVLAMEIQQFCAMLLISYLYEKSNTKHINPAPATLFDSLSVFHKPTRANGQQGIFLLSLSIKPDVSHYLGRWSSVQRLRSLHHRLQNNCNMIITVTQSTGLRSKWEFKRFY